MKWTYLEQIMKDVLSCSIRQACSYNICDQLGFVGFAKLHDRFLSTDVFFEVRVRATAAIIILSKRDLCVFL